MPIIVDIRYIYLLYVYNCVSVHVSNISLYIIIIADICSYSYCLIVKYGHIELHIQTLRIILDMFVIVYDNSKWKQDCKSKQLYVKTC